MRRCEALPDFVTLPAVSAPSRTASILALTSAFAVLALSGAPSAGASPAAPTITSPAAFAPSATIAAACTSVSYGGRTYVMYRRGVSCAFARRWVRRLHYTKRGPRGWRCGSGSGYRTGGGCARGRQSFGWHPGD